MPIILTEEREKEKGEGGRRGRIGRPVHAQMLTFMLMGRMNKEILGGLRGGEEERGMMKERELGGRGQREIGGERIRL